MRVTGKTAFVLEVGGSQYPAAEIEAKVKEQIKAASPQKTVKNLKIYIQPEAGCAYYTIDGEGSPDMCVPIYE